MVRVYSKKEIESRKKSEWRGNGRQKTNAKDQDKTDRLQWPRPGQTINIEVPLEIAEVLGNAQANFEQIISEIGVLVMSGFIKSEVEALTGPKNVHDVDRQFTRYGKEKSAYVVVAGKKVPIERPRVRTADGSAEAALSSYKLFQRDGQLERNALQKMLWGISTRNYERAVEEFGGGYGIKRSSISRRLKAATAAQLKKLMERDLSGLDLLAIGLDGIRFGEYTAVVAIGVDIEGRKHVLGLWEGASENAAVVGELLDDLIARGLSPEKEYLFFIDGSKALRKGIKTRFGKDVAVQRCQKHKLENVKKHLPKKYHGALKRRLRVAYGMKAYKEAKAELEKTTGWLEGISASAAASLREGFEESLTVINLELPELLRVTFRTTNMVESCFSGVRSVTGKVKRWRNGNQAARWAAAGLLDSERRFKRVKGYESMSVLRANLYEHKLKQKEVKTEKKIDGTKAIA